MAPAKSTEGGERKRPSRLLNLNNSPRAQKQLATSNAADSPLLSLPPEIRCRIWDYVFSDYVFHISSIGSRRRREVLCLTLCQSPQECKSLKFRYGLGRVSYGREDVCSQKTDWQKPDRVIPLQLLQVSRQIYHEAVLKPFTRATFHFKASWYEVREPTLLLDKLIPAQAKAITRLSVIYHNEIFMTQPLLRKFEGLRNLEIYIVTSAWSSRAAPFEQLKSFARRIGFVFLRDIGFKSIRITVVTRDHGGTGVDETPLVDWIRLEEDKIVPKQQQILTAD